ncbi:CocE/NonD family hydrolase [Aeromicrobium terrae]|uniref:CocE/NonD family hydrolase n=1 Tax=Aeromicrobium terrae TaxID=2498846 RepID=A0A5C8NLG4_9ACTN|nr:CocE/NonD family hydrolase [Aeromicrobium terrae]TXL62694.1 CocE/NonD family hydrolase [Aeromicrobium terrae]
MRLVAALAGLLLTTAGLAATPAAAADPEPTAQSIRFTTSDGVSLQTTLFSSDPSVPRPTVVEFSPYGNNSQTVTPSAGTNVLLVQIRGTGSSDGQFDALGPRNQADVPEVLQWACEQPWSNGSLGINGFSASAIIIYNSMHQQLPCVKAMVLKSGTFELYRDLLVPGGVSNIVPGAGVILLIGAPALLQGAERLERNPASSLDVLSGLFLAGLNAGLLHPTLDDFWKKRRFRGDVNHVPVLVIDGFFDVESRGAFQGYQQLRDDGAHLLVVGAHDGAPEGTDGGAAETNAWFDHYLSGVDNGVENHPRVQMLLSDGDREDMLAGQYVSRNATDWPVPGTTWHSLSLDATKSGSARSLNDGSLTLGSPGKTGLQTYLAAPTIPFNSDPPNTAILGGFGLNQLTTALPFLSQMDLTEPLGLSYTTRPLKQDVLAVGPAALDVRLSSTSPETAIWAVLTDVAPDGSSHPLTVGRLLTSFPDIDESKSLKDGNGTIVQPYGDFSRKTPLASLTPKLYHVELWPVGNRFKAGHRIRLDLVGASLASLPTLPGLTSVRVGGTSGSRLLLPVLPESNLPAALN